MSHFGNVLHPATGKSIGWVKDGKLTANNGKTYRVEGDKILSDTGEVVFYLSGLHPDAKGDGDLATPLFGSGE
jgi:hypothetical protein